MSCRPAGTRAPSRPRAPTPPLPARPARRTARHCLLRPPPRHARPCRISFIGLWQIVMVVANWRVALASDHAGEHGEAEGDAIPAERREVVGLYPPDEPAHHEKRRGR